MLKKHIALILIVCGLGAAALAATVAPPPRVGAFYAVYWVLGGAQSADPKASVEGREVVIYTPDSSGNIGTVFGYGYVSGGNFYINTFRTGNIVVGQTYQVAIPLGDDGYGANPVNLTISGLGFDKLGVNLTLAYGAGPGGLAGGPAGGPAGEQAPKIAMWFGQRLYQPSVYWLASSGNLPFVTTAQPQIKVELAIDPPYTLASDISAHQIVIDAGAAGAKTLTLTAANIAGRTYSAGTAAEDNKVSSMSLAYTLTGSELLASGTHTVSVTTRSSGLLGTAAAATQIATIEVLGGPLRLLGPVVVYPSPFNIVQAGNCEIQYTLSADAAIEIDIFSVQGTLTKRIRLDKSGNGGTAGLNKVKWDGKTELGTLAGNAVYVGTIVSRDDNKLLGKFKFTVLD